MFRNRQLSNILGTLAGLVLVGCTLVVPSRTHLHCRNDICRYQQIPIIGHETTYQFPLSAISDVSVVEERRGRYLHLFYEVYVNVADQHVEVGEFKQQQDADVLADKVKRFIKTPTEAPLDISHGNISGLLIGMGLLIVMLSLNFWKK